MLKLFTILVIAAVIGSSYQQDHAKFREKLRQNAEECVKVAGVNPELPRKAFQDGEFADDNNLKCFFKCMYEKMGHMDANGKIDLSGMVDHLPPDVDKAKVSETVTKCSQVKGEDTCQLAFDVAKCMRESWKQMQSD